MKVWREAVLRSLRTALRCELDTLATDRILQSQMPSPSTSGVYSAPVKYLSRQFPKNTASTSDMHVCSGAVSIHQQAVALPRTISLPRGGTLRCSPGSSARRAPCAAAHAASSTSASTVNNWTNRVQSCKSKNPSVMGACADRTCFLTNLPTHDILHLFLLVILPAAVAQDNLRDGSNKLSL